MKLNTTKAPFKQRTLSQNGAMHQWFKDISKECIDTGVTVPLILKNVVDVQVDEKFIKWIFRRIGQKKLGIKSTASLSKHDIDPIIEEMVKFFAQKVDPPVELPDFPHMEEGTEDEQGRVKYNNY